SAAAAGLFIVANVMFLAGDRSAPAPMASEKRSMAPSLARSEPSPGRDAAKDSFAEEVEADRALRRQEEPKKRMADSDAKQGAARPVESAKKDNANEAEKLIAGKEVLAKAPEPKTAAPEPAPVTAPPPAALPAKPATPVVRADAKPSAEAPADKPAE